MGPATKAVNSAVQLVQCLGFVFNGQGAQWELISVYPTFGKQINEASRIKSTRINEVDISRPSTVAIQLCLVDLLKSWNITPTAVTSHSSPHINEFSPPQYFYFPMLKTPLTKE